MIPNSKVLKLGGFSKGELVAYGDSDYPWRIRLLREELVKVLGRVG